MLSRPKILSTLLASLATVRATFHLSEDTPLAGPSFLANFDPSNTQAIQDAISGFPDLIEGFFSDETLVRDDLIFYIDVFSAATGGSIYSYKHVGDGQEDALTAGELDEHSIARVGSVTKLFTVYAVIAYGGIEVLAHPVTDYIPELAGSIPDGEDLEHIDWDRITVGALASQQAGVGGGVDLLLSFVDDLENITIEELAGFMKGKTPVTSAYRTAVYADGGFAVLAQVLARMTGKDYQDAVHDILFEPLGMVDSTLLAPTSPGGNTTGPSINTIDRTRLDVPFTSWGLDIPIVYGSGGLYTTAADLRAAGLSILNSELLHPAVTQAWMKPLSTTGSLVELVGAPWEITRLAVPVSPGSSRTRISDLYIKAGGNGDYGSIFALSPDHGIGYSIIVAGNTAGSARFYLRELVGEAFIIAAEHAAVENAQANLAGTYYAEDDATTNITLAVNEGRPGLSIVSYYEDGADNIAVLYGGLRLGPTTFQLYPTVTEGFSGDGSVLYKPDGAISVSHRFVAQNLPLQPRPLVDGGGGGLFERTLVWLSLDPFGPIDELVLGLVDGRVETVKVSASAKLLKRVD